MQPLEQVLAHALVLVAHPDDETIGAGALLRRIRDAVVVFATDGAPRDVTFWQAFGSREAYANERKNEALQALDIAGVQEVEFLADHSEIFVDQELFQHLAEALRLLSEIARGYSPKCILTLAYEGGHPDHDCCAFLGAQLASSFSLPIWEMPLYHRRTEGDDRRQEFLVRSNDEQTLELSQAEIELKKTMLGAYVSQREVLKGFRKNRELFRPHPAYDFSRPPHKGKLNYEFWEWPVTGADLCRAFKSFQASAHARPKDAVA
jgi:LmbE family N-acetylglucosaminyl deacetylase